MLTLAELAGLFTRSLGALDGDSLVLIRDSKNDQDIPISDIKIEDGMVILIPELD